MAQKLHISQEAYGKLERGETEMTVKRAKQLAEIFKVDETVFTTHQEIVVILPGLDPPQVHFKNQMDQADNKQELLNHLLPQIKACIKQEVQNLLLVLDGKGKRTRGLKSISGLVVKLSLPALQITDELLPLLAA